jgi:uncharacterized integral membrane protein (TIGR00697 family)
MYNELIFFFHIVLMSLSTLAALRMGKEALVAFICLQAVLANLFVVKQITLFGFTATGSDAFTIGTVLGLNLLQEYYGAEIAQKSIWISFGSLVFYGIVSQIHIGYVPHLCDDMQPHFVALLNNMPRIVIASFVVYFIAQQLDYALYGALKRMYNDKHLVLRNYCSVLVVQLVDTVLFSFFGLYGILDNIGSIIAVSYTIKVVAIVISTPFLALSRKLYTQAKS